MVSGCVQALLEQLRAQGIRDGVLNALCCGAARENLLMKRLNARHGKYRFADRRSERFRGYMKFGANDGTAQTTPQSGVGSGTGSGYQTAILAHLVHHVLLR